MTRPDKTVLWFGGLLIRLACLSLAMPASEDRKREWTNELYAVLYDHEIRWWCSRAARTIWFAADQMRSTLALAGSKRRRRPIDLVSGVLLMVMSPSGFRRTRSNGNFVRIYFGRACKVLSLCGLIWIVFESTTLHVAGFGVVMCILAYASLKTRVKPRKQAAR